MINAVIELGDRRIHEVMVPRIAIVALPATATFEEAIDTSSTRATRGSRSTRSRSTRSSGILYAKDLLPFLKAGPPTAGAAVAPAHAASSCPNR